MILIGFILVCLVVDMGLFVNVLPDCLCFLLLLAIDHAYKIIHDNSVGPPYIILENRFFLEVSAMKLVKRT